MEIKETIIIARDFAKTPGARYRADGDYSGEAFLEDILLPAFDKSIQEEYKILVDLDNVWGYPSSFISGSFGKLSLEKGAETVLNQIEFKSEESKTRLDEIIQEIKNPRTHDTR